MEFDPFDISAASLKKENLPSREIDNLISEVFITPAGLKLLGYLEQITIARPVIKPPAEPKDGYFREGQNDLVRQIIESLAREQNQSLIIKKIRKAYRKLLST